MQILKNTKIPKATLPYRKKKCFLQYNNFIFIFIKVKLTFQEGEGGKGIFCYFFMKIQHFWPFPMCGFHNINKKHQVTLL